MSCGVPIVGYANEAWFALSKYSKSGIVAKTGDTSSMADEIAKLKAIRRY
jgi:glycosyltransferase involved in cell wall biosynthesis